MLSVWTPFTTAVCNSLVDIQNLCNQLSRALNEWLLRVQTFQSVLFRGDSMFKGVDNRTGWVSAPQITSPVNLNEFRDL